MKDVFHFNGMKKTVRRILILLAAAVSVCPACAGVFSRNRFVRVLPTKYFDIMFPRECSYAADLIAEHGDAIYDEVRNEMHLKYTFRMPVVISADSDVLSASYSASPYNRIIIYDAPAYDKGMEYDDALIGLFTEEVNKAVCTSIRHPFWQVTSKILGTDGLQPSNLVNMPYSFVEGAAVSLADGENGGLSHDSRSVELLTQAKLENAFPSWIKASGARDIYPETVSAASGAAFAAYLMQSRGIEKYAEFWKDCGTFHLFRFTAGTFRKVYGEKLADVWNEFRDSIPLPENCEEIIRRDRDGTALVQPSKNGLYRWMRSTPYGLVWYDEAANEVRLLPPVNKENEQPKPELLFIATDVTFLSVSLDGTYLSVSLRKSGVYENLYEDRVWIYNLAERSFVSRDLHLRSGSVITLAGGKQYAAGVSHREQQTELVVCPVDDDGSGDSAVYTRTFARNVIPYSLEPIVPGKAACLVRTGTKSSLLVIDFADGKEERFDLPDGTEDMHAETGSILFSYHDDDSCGFERAGYITAGADGVPSALFLQTADVSGGVHSASFADDEVVYCAYKTRMHEIREVKRSELAFEEKQLVKTDDVLPVFNSDSIPVIHGGKLGDAELKMFNPFPYVFRGTWIPMLPVSKISFDGYQLSPGIGVTYLLQTDPLNTVDGVLSFSKAYADPETSYQTFIDQYSLTAFLSDSFLPVTITAGGCWKFDEDGHYSLNVLTGGKWKMPVGMSYQKLQFNLQTMWTCSTSYTDSASGTTTELNGWPSVKNAFNNIAVSLGGTYSNYQQAGISPYEMRGFETGAEAVFNFDFQKMDWDSSSTESNSPYNPELVQFNVLMGVKLPRLTPLPDYGNWVLGIPLTFHMNVYGAGGTLNETYAEVLLAGFESQDGIPVVNLYLTRFGLKLGYDMQVKYNSLKLPQLDFSQLWNYYTNVKEASVSTYAYLTLESVFTPVIGMFSRVQITGDAQLRYFPSSDTWKFAMLWKYTTR